MLGPTQIDRLEAVIMFSWNVTTMSNSVNEWPFIRDHNSRQQVFLCNMCHQIVSSQQPLPSCDLRRFNWYCSNIRGRTHSKNCILGLRHASVILRSCDLERLNQINCPLKPTPPRIAKGLRQDYTRVCPSEYMTGGGGEYMTIFRRPLSRRFLPGLWSYSATAAFLPRISL